jgi:hypothetical protein
LDEVETFWILLLRGAPPTDGKRAYNNRPDNNPESMASIIPFGFFFLLTLSPALLSEGRRPWHMLER